MASKPPILVPRQVLCPVMQWRTGHWPVYVEIALSIGKQTRKCHRKKVRSGKHAGVVSVVGQGITGGSTLRCVLSGSPSLDSDTTSFTAASTCACTLTPGSGRITPETVESSVQSVSPASNCCGAGPWSSTRSVSENSTVLRLDNSPSSGKFCVRRPKRSTQEQQIWA